MKASSRSLVIALAVIFSSTQVIAQETPPECGRFEAGLPGKRISHLLDRDIGTVASSASPGRSRGEMRTLTMKSLELRRRSGDPVRHLLLTCRTDQRCATTFPAPGSVTV